MYLGVPIAIGVACTPANLSWLAKKLGHKPFLMGYYSEDQIVIAMDKKKEKARRVRDERIAKIEENYKEQLRSKRAANKDG